MQLQNHPFAPVYNKQSKILIMGSFPSVKSREIGFYYGNPNNRFWQMLGAVLKDAVPADTQGRIDFLLNHCIALWDALASCEINGSSDSSIRNPVPNDLNVILQESPILRVLANGQLASRMIQRYHNDKIEDKLLTLPSTSPANASWSLERLIEIWSPAILK